MTSVTTQQVKNVIALLQEGFLFNERTFGFRKPRWNEFAPDFFIGALEKRIVNVALRLQNLTRLNGFAWHTSPGERWFWLQPFASCSAGWFQWFADLRKHPSKFPRWSCLRQCFSKSAALFPKTS